MKAVNLCSAWAKSSFEYTGVISLIYPVKFTIVRSAAHFTGAKAPPVPLHFAGRAVRWRVSASQKVNHFICQMFVSTRSG